MCEILWYCCNNSPTTSPSIFQCKIKAITQDIERYIFSAIYTFITNIREMVSFEGIEHFFFNVVWVIGPIHILINIHWLYLMVITGLCGCEVSSMASLREGLKNKNGKKNWITYVLGCLSRLLTIVKSWTVKGCYTLLDNQTQCQGTIFAIQ